MAPKPFGVADLAIACVFGGFFTALALADVSVDRFAAQQERLDVLHAYLTWKGAQPIIGTMLLVLMLPLPFVLYEQARDEVGGLFLRPQQRARHVTGTVGFVALLGVLGYVLSSVLPKETAFRETFQASAPQDTRVLAEALAHDHLIMLLLNLLMLVLPFLKYKYSQPATAAKQD